MRVPKGSFPVFLHSWKITSVFLNSFVSLSCATLLFAVANVNMFSVIAATTCNNVKSTQRSDYGANCVCARAFALPFGFSSQLRRMQLFVMLMVTRTIDDLPRHGTFLVN